jgi:hypothetical protein
MHKPYCCEMFKSLLDAMGERGLSVVLKQEMEFTYFSLQSRGIDHGAKLEHGRTAQGGGTKVNILTEIGLQFCPACGADLAEWIRKHSNEVKELIARSKPFYETWQAMAQQQKRDRTS